MIVVIFFVFNWRCIELGKFVVGMGCVVVLIHEQMFLVIIFFGVIECQVVFLIVVIDIGIENGFALAFDNDTACLFQEMVQDEYGHSGLSVLVVRAGGPMRFPLVQAHQDLHVMIGEQLSVLLCLTVCRYNNDRNPLWVLHRFKCFIGCHCYILLHQISNKLLPIPIVTL
jgi:hypothetical protein